MPLLGVWKREGGIDKNSNDKIIMYVIKMIMYDMRERGKVPIFRVISLLNGPLSKFDWLNSVWWLLAGISILTNPFSFWIPKNLISWTSQEKNKKWNNSW